MELVERADKVTSKGRPMELSPAWLRDIDHLLRRWFHLESGTNIFPLGHIVAYYALFATLAIPGLVQSTPLTVALWLLLLWMNYSLSIGVMHLHAHRKLFTDKLPNRIVEALLTFPSLLSYPMMAYVHVHLHHKYQDASCDPTSTQGYESGWRAVWYWLRYAYVCQKSTIGCLFDPEAPRRWRNLRRQYLVDSIGPIILVDIYFFFDPWQMVFLWLVPFILTCINIGFFAWLTHAPARDGTINGSFNTTGRIQNLFMHNQGYHLIHHMYPGVHWTRIPDRLEPLLKADDDLFVNYWVLLPSSWRVALPRYLRQHNTGKRWKQRYREKAHRGNLRIRWMPWFGWV